MSSGSSKTSLWIYVPVIILGGFIIGLVFSKNFSAGVEVGMNTPPPPEGHRTAVVAVDLRALAKDASLALKGKSLYQINCASCHGAEGQGDGPRAAGLNPPPRKYGTEEFKYGNDIVSIFNTITQGSPGTSMPAFALLTSEDRMAMAHYVRTMVPNPAETTDEIVSKLPEAPAGASAGASHQVPKAAATTAPDSNRIPIRFAMERLATDHPPMFSSTSPDWSLPGAQIYTQRCAQCHGARGEGAVTNYISVAPYRYSPTKSLANPTASWFHNRDEFGQIVIHGLPGRMMPGNATLTRQQIDDLYVFVRALAGR